VLAGVQVLCLPLIVAGITELVPLNPASRGNDVMHSSGSQTASLTAFRTKAAMTGRFWKGCAEPLSVVVCQLTPLDGLGRFQVLTEKELD